MSPVSTFSLLMTALVIRPDAAPPPSGSTVQASAGVTILRAARVSGDAGPAEIQRRERRDAAGRLFIDFT